MKIKKLKSFPMYLLNVLYILNITKITYLSSKLRTEFPLGLQNTAVGAIWFNIRIILTYLRFFAMTPKPKQQVKIFVSSHQSIWISNS